MSPRQSRGYYDLQSEFALPEQETLWDIEKAFKNPGKLVVEIGFGMGKSLIEMAKNNPDTNYIGIEVHPPGIGSFIADADEAKLTNVRIASFDAVQALNSCIAPNSLDGIQVFFPDPWPKARHHKRRIIQTDFVQTLARALKPGGYLHLATDWEDYAHHMLDVLKQEPMLENQSSSDDFVPKPAARPETKFEARGIRLGHGVWDLMFKRV